MYEAKFKLEAITPIYMRGANQNKVEIRAPSIKGLMRWWFRAFSMGVLWNGSIQQRSIIGIISKKESDLFGSTKRKSKIKVEIENIQLNSSNRFNFKIRGGKYLGYGLNLNNTVMGSFELKTIFSSYLKDFEIKSILYTIWGIVYLGGIGGRNRRGFGNIKVNRVSNEKLREMFIVDGDLSKFLSNNLKDAISVYERLYETSMKRDLRVVPPIPCIHPDFLQIKISNKIFKRLDSSKNMEGVMDFCGCLLREFREDKINRHYRTIKGRRFSYFVSQNYREVKDFLHSNSKPNSLNYSIFGLPHQYQFASLNNRKAVVRGEIHKRRASPLVIKIYEYKGNYIPAILLFRSMFLPDNEKLCIEESGNPNKIVCGISQPSYIIAQNFVNRFPGRDIKW